MSQQISMEDALAAFREQHGKVVDENVLLRAQVAGLKRRLAELEQTAPPPAAGEDAQPAATSHLAGEDVDQRL